MVNLYIERVTKNAKLPEKKTDDAACYDIRANIDCRKINFFRSSNVMQTQLCYGTHQLYPGERAMIPTGLKMCCDKGWKIIISPRSGSAIKLGVTLINCNGILDADFRDEAMLLMVNHSNHVIDINHDDRIAQLSLEKVYDVNIILGELPKTDSNRKGGMGHTGDK